MRDFIRSWRLLGLAAIVLIAAPAWAQTRNFNVPPQDARIGIPEFARQADIQILVPEAMVDGKRTGAVIGTYTIDAGLSLLIAGTDLVVASNDGKTITLRATSSKQSSIGIPSPDRTSDGTPFKPSTIDPPTSIENGLEEVIVTARRHEEKLQSIPIVVTVLTQDKLEKERIESATNLQYFVPSFEVLGPGLIIRGQGTSNLGAGTFGSVLTYLNDVPFTNFEFGPGEFYDLADLEVLKGPQGTLFGRNTTGGAILLNSKRPTNNFEGYGQFTAGNFNDHEFEGALNIPVIADKLLVRVPGNIASRDGYTKVISTGLDQNNRDYQAGRVSITMRPTDNIDNDIVYDYYHSRTNGAGFYLLAVNPTGPEAKAFPAFVKSAITTQQQIGIYAEANSVTPLGAPFSYAKLWGITDTSTWDVMDELKLKNIVAYRSTSFSANYDPSTAGVISQAVPGNATAPATIQETEELQLQGQSLADKLNWVTGGFLLFAHNGDQEPNIGDIYSLGQIRLTTALPGSRSKALFAQGTYDLGDFLEGLKFTAGYRYTWDDVWNTVTSYSVKATGKTCTYAPLPPSCTLSANKDFHAPSWTVGVDYNVAPNTLAYVSARRGYKSGGLNPSTPLPSALGFGPEYVTDVEIGVKSDWEIMGIKARTDVDAYSDSYDRIQLATTVASPTGTLGQVTLNGGTATIQGVEFEGTIIPFKDFDLQGVYSYGYGHYGSFITSIPIGSVQYAGLPLHTFSLTGRYRLPLPEEWGDVSFSSTLSYRSHTVLSQTVGPFGVQSGYGVLNARIDWANILGYPIDAGLFVTNATNYAAKDFGYTTYSTIGFVAAEITEPRMFGIQLKYRFGPGLIH